MQKPVNQSCLRNQDPIFQALKDFFNTSGSVLELACGTAQHAVYLAQRLPQLTWQPSDLLRTIEGANQWITESKLDNLKPAIELDISKNNWPAEKYDYMYCANLLHFVSDKDVGNIFKHIALNLKSEGLFAVYGPFNQDGFTSEGNRSLNHWLLTEVDSKAGIKELKDIVKLARCHQLELINNEKLPANNHLLVFKKLTSDL